MNYRNEVSKRAAEFMEENHISGDTMIQMNHNTDDLDADQIGAINLYDLLADFVNAEVILLLQRLIIFEAGNFLGRKDLIPSRQNENTI